MKFVETPPEFSRQQSRLWLATWLSAGLGLLLLCVAGIVVVQGAEREKRQMLAHMQDRANVLIWALEGGARSMRIQDSRSPVPQILIEEVAKQPNIVYVALVDAHNRVAAHSDPEQIGELLHNASARAELANPTDSQGGFRLVGEARVFEVFKKFTPAKIYPHGNMGNVGKMNGMGTMGQMRDMGHMGEMGHMGRGRGRMGGDSAQQSESKQGESKQGEVQDFYIFVGIDPSPFEESLQEHLVHSVIIAVLIVLVSFAGVVLLFMVQNYKLSRRMLKDTQVLASQVLESLPIGIFALNMDKELSVWNKPLAAMLGFSASEKSKLPILNFPHADWQAILDEIEDKGLILEQEIELCPETGKTMPVSLTASKLFDSQGVQTGYLFILRDLGEVKKLQKQIRLGERLTALGNLAAGVAHEIRNPLSSIKGYALYLASKFSPDDAAHEAGQTMVQEVERLDRVVSDLLGMAKPSDLQLKLVSIKPLAEHAMRLALPDALSQGVSIELVENSESANMQAVVDADRLIQALLNLLLNAVQACKAGDKVVLEIKKQADGQRKSAELLSISIADTGAGMSSKELANIFTPYFTTKASGTGLGLTITHQIVEQHGGEIKVQSKQGKGTEFIILLPLGDDN